MVDSVAGIVTFAISVAIFLFDELSQWNLRRFGSYVEKNEMKSN